MNVLVTGAKGFIGSNLCEWLRPDVTLLTFELGDRELRERLDAADFVYHLAGVMRPDNEEEFEEVNVGLTERICEHLSGRKVPIVFTSSVQAMLNNPYGRSKRRAENVLDEYAVQNGAPVLVYRLTNVFGKWAKPNYTSVVATFCHNIARDLEIEISDPGRELALIYIDDVARSFLEDLDSTGSGLRYRHVEPHYHVTLGDLAGLIRSFHTMVKVPDLRGFTGKLYGTYVSYLDRFSYALDKKQDDRGFLAELIKADSFGQIFVSRTKPGVTRGGHFHRTKAEKFLVLEGRAVVRLRHLLDGRVVAIKVSGMDMRPIDIAPGYVHSIENVGTGDLITLFWASEVFDPDNPDTYREPNVLRP